MEPAATDVQFAEGPTLSPAEVPVRLPQSLAGAAEQMELVARLDALDLASYDENADVTATVPLEVPEPLRSPWTTLSRPSVQASFNIRKLSDSVVLPNIPLRINADPLTLQEYDIVLGPNDYVLRDVRFTGPSDAIEAIASGREKPWAYVLPSRSEIEAAAASNQPVMLTPTIVAPPGVQANVTEPVPVTIRRK